MTSITPNIVYTQHVHALDVVPVVDNLENVVVTVKWEIIARSGIHVCSTNLTTQLHSVQNPENFVSLNDLTEAQVLTWVTAVEPVDQLQQQLADQLQEKMHNPVVELLPPWGQSADWRQRLFVLVHNDQVVWGPARWKVDNINAALQEHNVAVTIDKSWLSVPQTPAVQLGAHTWLYVAVEHWDEISDPLFYTHDPVVWQFSQSQGAVGTHTVVQRPLEEIKQTMIADLAAASVNHDFYAGVVSVNISGTDIEIPQQQLLVSVCAALHDGPDTPLQITDISGQPHTVDLSDLKQALSQWAVTVLSPPEPDPEIEGVIAQITAAESLSELVAIQQEQQ